MKKIALIDLISFAMCVLLYTLFSLADNTMEVNAKMILVLYVMCLIIAVLVTLTQFILQKLDAPMIADIAATTVICYIVVTTVGVLGGMFALSWDIVLSISPIIIPTMIVTYFLSYFSVVQYANEINDMLVEKNDPMDSGNDEIEIEEEHL